MKRIVVISLSILLMSGCAMMSPVQLGQTAGTIAGAAAVPGVGAPLGALIGTLVGSVFQKQVDKVTEKRERKELAEQLDTDPVSVPSYRQAAGFRGEPVRVWVDEIEQNGEVLAGHFEVRYLE